MPLVQYGSGSGSNGTITISATAPFSPTDQQLWWDTTYQMLWYYDLAQTAWFSVDKFKLDFYGAGILNGGIIRASGAGTVNAKHQFYKLRPIGISLVVTITTALTATNYVTCVLNNVVSGTKTAFNTQYFGNTNNLPANSTGYYNGAFSSSTIISTQNGYLELDFSFTSYTAAITVGASLFYEINRV
jgi:hypothetical protein